MKLIPLSRGMFAQVDDENYEMLSKYKWSAQPFKYTVYAIAFVNGATIRMHRLIMGATERRVFIDHKDGNGLNNQIGNLRSSTPGQNNVNRRKLKATTSSFKGVHKVVANGREYWYCAIRLNGCATYYRVASELDAAIKYNELAKEHFGEFASLNTILKRSIT